MARLYARHRRRHRPGRPGRSRRATRSRASSRSSVLMPMLLLIPVLGVVVAWALKRGLQPLHDTSRRVSDRDAARLDPLPTDNVPRELAAARAPDQRAARAARRRPSTRSAASSPTRRTSCARPWRRSRSRCSSPSARRPPRSARGALHELARGVERARRLVQQLMDFARLDAAVPLQAFAAVNLAALAREVVAGYAVRAENAGRRPRRRRARRGAGFRRRAGATLRSSRTWSTTRCAMPPPGAR